MAQTKVTDDVREVTEVDAAKITTGTIPEARITSLAASKLTGTVDNARISLDAAEIPDLAASKITTGELANDRVAALPASKITSGTVDVARLPSTVLNSNVPAVDLTAVRQDIAMLALYNAVSDNRAAYNLPYSFIDQFEDDTGVTTQTDVDNVSEYFATAYTAYTTTSATATDWTGATANFTISGDTVQTTTQGDRAMYFNPVLTGDFNVMLAQTPSTGTAVSLHWGIFSNSQIGSFNNNSQDGGGMIWGSLTSEAWNHRGYQDRLYYSGGSYVTGSVADGALAKFERIGSTVKFYSPAVAAFGSGTLIHTFSNTSSADCRMSLGTGGAPGAGRLWDDISYTTQSTADSATGTLVSDTQTAPDTVTKMSGVILYKDNVGTATLGTHLVISFSANGGSNYTEAASYGTVTPLFSTGVKMVRLGETTLSHSGTTPVIKAVWATQEEGVRETQLHGWAMNY